MSVLFTEAATAKASGQDGDKNLWMSMGMTVLLGGGFALVCVVFPELVMRLLFGTQYVTGGPLLAVIAPAMALLATANVLFVYSQARNEFGFMWVQGVGVALFATMVVVKHDSAMQVAYMLLASVVFILAATLAWFFLKVRRANAAA